jgi:uncharacterized membrane protein
LKWPHGCTSVGAGLAFCFRRKAGAAHVIETGSRTDLAVRAIGIADLKEAWSRGVRDFRAAPAYGLVFGGFFAACGITIVLTVAAIGLGYLAYPLAAGFTLIGPFAAVGLYEVSRRKEAGLATTWPAVLGAFLNRQLTWMGLVTLFFFVVWMYQVQLALFLGARSSGNSLREFMDALTTTPDGLLLLVLGTAAGALLSIVPLSVTLVSFPLLLDRDIDFVTAMTTSVRAMVTSPLAAIGWGATIIVLLILACLPFFLGLVIVLPILGHTTWHLYRKIVVSEPAVLFQPHPTLG